MAVKQLSPQLRTILAHVERAGHITSRHALIDHGIQALPRRMADLKELGYRVRKEYVKNPATGQRYMRYAIDGKVPILKVGDRVQVATTKYDRVGFKQSGDKGVVRMVDKPINDDDLYIKVAFDEGSHASTNWYTSDDLKLIA